ncbi:hypothetical protein EDM57_05000 [Brevibacillus gelatini]|uniref:Large polyvalent protein associated domain-containing protein n=1 Tax=Brevibacillus gelatini TaxID=1655277 RepID=A0A3M8B813_9BACL|nr:hypothetical protein [Brevibacillus gelatini]RNB59500.1 hypothetical protein EDM57_05000 [Brevibacillus gelatini]
MKYQTDTIVKMKGCPVKKENGVFEIDRIWIENDTAFVYKLKKDGTRAKNGLNIFKFSHMDKYGTIISKEELTSAISEVNKTLKESKDNETVYTYQETDRKELQKGDYIQVVKPIQTFNSIYAIPIGVIYTISACEGQNANKYVWKRIGKKGQILSGNSGAFNIISFSTKTVERLLAEGYIVIVEQVQQTRKKMNQQQETEQSTVEQATEQEEQTDNQVETQEEPVKKHHIQSVQVTRLEGYKWDCKTVAVSTIVEANKVIQEMAWSAPSDGSYDKTQFVITFTDGSTYTGRIDLQYKHTSGYDLERHVMRHISYMIEQGTDEQNEHGRDFLTRYVLSEEPVKIEEVRTEHPTQVQVEQEQQAEITGTIDDNGLIVLTNEQATELEKRFVYDKATKQEQELLKQYHLQLQEQAMKYAQTLPDNYESLIDDNKLYQVVSCFPADGGSAGIYEIEVTGSELKHMLWRKVDILNIITPLEAEQQPEQHEAMEHEENQEQQTEQVPDNAITVTLNQQLQGIEIAFTEKPSQEVIEQLKTNGFRWSKFKKIWFTKQSEKALAFAQSLSGQMLNNSDTITDSAQEQQTYSYPEININDLEKYTVSDELQRMVHSSSLFEVDYKKDCAVTFQQFQNEALEVLALTDDPRMTYYIKKYLQSFKKRYYEQYLKILNHRASNPSWAVTGRGGLNVSRYNKMQDRYDKYLGEAVKLSEEFKKKMRNFRWQIKRDKEQQVKQFIEQELNKTENSLTFQTEKREINVGRYTEIVRAYIHGEYMIAKSFGCFRIFKNGQEVHSMKTSDRLDDAKKMVAFMICKEEEQDKILI